VLRLLPAALIIAAITALPALADDPSATITIKDHHFIPENVEIPAGTKVKLTVRNDGDETSEFESVEFHREKVVQAHSDITVYVGPLEPGSYEFFDDFHPDTRGHLVVK
jgi:plastocyanin